MPDPVFFFNDTATTEIYTLSLHDALPIFKYEDLVDHPAREVSRIMRWFPHSEDALPRMRKRSEEHTSELQSRLHLVCRLLLQNKKAREWSQRYTCRRAHTG